jgi:hypothetical protein
MGFQGNKKSHKIVGFLGALLGFETCHSASDMLFVQKDLARS